MSALPQVVTLLVLLERVPLVLIVVLSALAASIVGRNLWTTLKERRALRLARSNFARAAREARVTDNIVPLVLAGVAPGSMIARRVQLLYKTRQIYSISATLLDRLDQLEDTAHYRFVRFVTGILLVLGLLGTVIGLTLSVKGLLPAIETTQRLSDVTVLTQAMAHTLSGLGTAFNATLAALACTFLLSLATAFVQRFETAFVHALEEFLTYDLIPKILLSSEIEGSTLYVEAIRSSAGEIARAAEVLDRSREGIQTIVDGLVVATRTAESRTVDFFNFAQTFRDSVSGLVGHADDLKQTYGRIHEVLSEIQQNQLTHKLVGEVVDKAVARALGEADEHATSVRQAFKKDVEELLHSQQKYVEAVEHVAAAVREAREQQAAGTQAALKQALDEVVTALRKSLEQVYGRDQATRMVFNESLEHFRRCVSEATRQQEALLVQVSERAARAAQAAVGQRPAAAQGGERADA